jgi:hypothetical protein
MPLINNARHWRARAEEARTQAASMTDPQIREAMLKVAADYDHLAALAEARTIPSSRTGTPTIG